MSGSLVEIQNENNATTIGCLVVCSVSENQPFRMQRRLFRQATEICPQFYALYLSYSAHCRSGKLHDRYRLRLSTLAQLWWSSNTLKSFSKIQLIQIRTNSAINFTPWQKIMTPSRAARRENLAYNFLGVPGL